MRDDAWSESYVATQITSCGKLVGFIWTKLVPRTCPPPEKSVHFETVAFRESRPVALPNPLHLAILSARLFPGSSILRAKVLAPVISSRASSVPTAIICCVSVWFGSRDYGAIGPLSSCYADSTAHVQFSEVQRNDRLTTVRPIVGKFEGIAFT